MKSRESRYRQKFAFLECYSGRYAATLPPFSGTELHTSMSPASKDSRVSSRLFSATNSPVMRSPSNLYLKPCEVLHSHFQPDSSHPAQDQLFLKAYRYRAEGFFKSAVQHYTQLLQQAPDHIQARINLGVCFLKLGQVAKAHEVYEQTVAPGSSDFRLLYNFSIVQVLEGDHEGAKNSLDEAMQTASGSLVKEIDKLREAVVIGLASKQVPESKVVAKTDVSHDVTVSFTKGTKSCGNFSFSRIGSKPSVSFLSTKATDSSRPVLWKVFKTVADYSSRPITAHTPRSVKKPLSTSLHSKPVSILSPRPTKSRRRLAERESMDRLPSGHSEPELKHSVSFKNQDLVRVRMNGDLLEEDLEAEVDLRRSHVDEALDFSVRTKAFEVGSVLSKEACKLEKERELLPTPDITPVLGTKLGADALVQVRAELRKDLDQRNFDVLLREVSRLKFFVKLLPEVRRKFLRIGLLRTAQHREELFRQGDQGDFMYVILHGSVTVSRQAPDFGHEALAIDTLYDGDSFGELGLYSLETHGKPEGRNASCFAAELTDLLLISKVAYQSIMQNELESLLDQKIAFLSSLPFFYGGPLMNLIPLASNLEPMVFTFNESILRKGETPKGLFILLSGACSIYSEGFCLRPKKLASYATARIRSPLPTPFRIGNTTFHSPKPKDWDPELGQTPDPALAPETIARDQRMKSELLAFFPGADLEELLKNHYVTHERILKKTLQTKDYFGGRALLETASHDTAFFQRKNGPSKYTVVAESSKVEVILIARFQLPLLGEKLMGQMRKFLDKDEDLDCPEGLSQEEIDGEFRRWAQYKANLIDQSRRRQYLVRSKDPGAVL